MISLARKRLDPWEDRVELVISEGGPPDYEPTGAYDRFISNFVFDLLSEGDTRAVLAEAARLLRPGGLLCLSGLSSAVEPVPKILPPLAAWIHDRVPALLGGCRPVDLASYLGDAWQCLHYRTQTAFGVPSEAMVYQRI